MINFFVKEDDVFLNLGPTHDLALGPMRNEGATAEVQITAGCITGFD